MSARFKGSMTLACLASALFLTSPSQSQTVTSYSGNAFGSSVHSIVGSVDQTFAPTGNLPPAGGTLTNSVANAAVNISALGFLFDFTTGVQDTMTTGGGGTANSSAIVNGFSLRLDPFSPAPSLAITADTVTALTTATAFGVTGSSIFTNLAVVLGGIDLGVAASGAPNQVVLLPGLGTLTINEQFDTSAGFHNEITTNALDLRLNDGSQVIVAHANSDVNFSPAAVPEGSSVALVAGGLLPLAGLGIARRKRK